MTKSHATAHVQTSVFVPALQYSVLLFVYHNAKLSAMKGACAFDLPLFLNRLVWAQERGLF